MPNVEFETEFEIYQPEGELLDIIDIEVSATVMPVIRGRYFGKPEDCYPDEGGGVEDMVVKAYGYEIQDKLTTDELEKLAEEAIEVEEKNAKDDAYNDRY